MDSLKYTETIENAALIATCRSPSRVNTDTTRTYLSWTNELGNTRKLAASVDKGEA
jgi:hypothetical protein